MIVDSDSLEAGNMAVMGLEHVTLLLQVSLAARAAWSSLLVVCLGPASLNTSQERRLNRSRKKSILVYFVTLKHSLN